MALNITPRRKSATEDTTAEAPATELEAAIAADKVATEEKPARRRTTRTRTTRTSRAKTEETTADDEPAEDEEKPKTSRRRTSSRTRAAKSDDEKSDTSEEGSSDEDEPKPRPSRRSSSRATASRATSSRATSRATDSGATASGATAASDTEILALLDKQTKELERQAKTLDQHGKHIAELEKLQRETLERIGKGTQTGGRVGVFVDVANVELAIDKLNRRVSWTKVLKKVSKDRQLVCAVAYSPVHEDINVSMESQRFTEPFVNQGFRMVTKPLKKFSDGTVKANVDIEMTIEILEMLDRLDILCLVSGDGDFEPLVKTAQKKGIKVEVVSVGQATAMALKRASDQFIDLANILNEVGV